MTACMASMPELEAQKNKIAQISKQNLVKQDTWCLVDKKWCIQWKRYVGFDNKETANLEDKAAHPGSIDNTPLLRDDGSGELKDHLIDELDYVLLPEDAWNLLVKWYGLVEGQQVISRKVVEYGMLATHCKVEVYLLELKLSSDSNLENVVTKKFSRSDTIGYIEQEMRSIFNIKKETETRLWKQHSHNLNEHLSNKESTIQDAGLYHGQVLIIEVKNNDGTWSGQVKRLEVAVVRKDNYGFKVKDKIDFLDAIGEAILKLPEKEFAPRFSSTRIQDKYLIVSPVDELSKDWLLSAVPMIKLWGTTLHANLASLVPKLYTALVWFAGKKLNAKLSLQALHRQNIGLEASKWCVLKSFQKGPCLRVMVVMEEASVIALRSCNFKPFFKSDRAKVRLYGGKENNKCLKEANKEYLLATVSEEEPSMEMEEASF